MKEADMQIGMRIILHSEKEELIEKIIDSLEQTMAQDKIMK